MTRPNELGVRDAAAAIRSGAIRSVDLVQACLDRIAARDDAVRAWTFLDQDGALASARARDAERPRGLLHGVPIGIKDIIDTRDMPTACGSEIYAARQPAWDAACVALVKRAGGIVLGKTVTTEFAYFTPGPTRNPHALDHTPGGSSSGSAAAVADCMVPAAFGTQTAASLTRPASFCGVVGYKPTYGDFSVAGIRGLAESFDTLGTITRKVADARLLRAVLLGIGDVAPASRATALPSVGVCRTPWWDAASADTQHSVLEAASRLQNAGAAVSDFELPTDFGELAECHRTIMGYEAARNLAYEHEAHRSRLSAALLALVEAGLATPRAQYLAARRTCERARVRFGELIGQCDVLLAPSARGEAPAGLGATGDPLFSRMWMLLGVPSVTLPGSTGSTGLPVGVQLVARVGEDERLLDCAEWAERHIHSTRGATALPIG